MTDEQMPLDKARDILLHPGGFGRSMVALAAAVVVAEFDRLRERKPCDADHAYDWLYERAEDAATAGLTLDQALQSVRDGYSSIAADRMIAADP